MDDNLEQYKSDTSYFLRSLGSSLATIAQAQRGMAETISKLDKVTKADAQNILADDLSELSSEVLKLAKNARALAQKQKLLAQKEENGKKDK